jgi:hypothetical protein
MSVFIYSKLHGANNPSTVVVAGSFKPQGTSAPTLSAGRGVAVTRLAAGKYAVTLVDTTLCDYIGGACSLGMAAPDGSRVDFVTASGETWDATNRRVVIQATLSDYTDSHDAVELDASSGGSDDGSEVSFVLCFTKSTLPVT